MVRLTDEEKWNQQPATEETVHRVKEIMASKPMLPRRPFTQRLLEHMESRYPYKGKVVDA